MICLSPSFVGLGAEANVEADAGDREPATGRPSFTADLSEPPREHGRSLANAEPS